MGLLTTSIYCTLLTGSNHGKQIALLFELSVALSRRYVLTTVFPSPLHTISLKKNRNGLLQVDLSTGASSADTKNKEGVVDSLQRNLMEFEIQIQMPEFSQNVSIESQSEISKKLTSSVGTKNSNSKTRHATSFYVPERSQGERLGYKTEITGDDCDIVKLEGDTNGTHSASENSKGVLVNRKEYGVASVYGYK